MGEKVWGEYKNDVFEHHNIITDKTLCEITTFDFKSGYNKAIEKYNYTEEDLRKAINMARKFPYITKGEIKFDTSIDEIINSLQQTKMPVGFECEDEVYMYSINGDIMKPKTTTNSQGQSVWVGKYIFKD